MQGHAVANACGVVAANRVGTEKQISFYGSSFICDQRGDMLAAQYSAFCPLDEGKTCLNGRLTLGENIADLGGLAVAYDAMKKATADSEDPMTEGMTRDQRFFANWATVWRRNFTPEELSKRLVTDEHALAEFRAIGAPSNLPAFAAAFGCKPGDPMVRSGEDQVVIW